MNKIGKEKENSMQFPCAFKDENQEKLKKQQTNVKTLCAHGPKN